MAGGNIKTLVRMANQISDFFQPYSRDEAVAGVQNHILKFWSPAMRRDLGVHIDHGGDGLRPEVIEAFKLITQTQSPTARATGGPEELGQMACDAG
jgi:formate dehydrogenase subunit delta